MASCGTVNRAASLCGCQPHMPSVSLFNATMNEKPNPIRIIISMVLAILLLRYLYGLISMYLKYGVANTHGDLKQTISAMFFAVIGFFTIIALLLPYNKRCISTLTNPWPISILSTLLIVAPVFLFFISKFTGNAIIFTIFGFVLALNLKFKYGDSKRASYLIPIYTAIGVAVLPVAIWAFVAILILLGGVRVG